MAIKPHPSRIAAYNRLKGQVLYLHQISEAVKAELTWTKNPDKARYLQARLESLRGRKMILLDRMKEIKNGPPTRPWIET